MGKFGELMRHWKDLAKGTKVTPGPMQDGFGPEAFGADDGLKLLVSVGVVHARAEAFAEVRLGIRHHDQPAKVRHGLRLVRRVEQLPQLAERIAVRLRCHAVIGEALCPHGKNALSSLGPRRVCELSLVLRLFGMKLGYEMQERACGASRLF